VDETDFEFEFDFSPERQTATEEEWHEGPDEEESPAWREDAGRAGGRPLSPEVAKRRRIAALAVAALVLLIILVVVLTQGSSARGGAYRSYLTALSPIAADSEQAGGSLSHVLAGSGSAKTEVVAKLDALVQQAVSDVKRAQALTPPEALRSEHAQALAALDLRLTGLQGIRDTLAQALDAADTTSWEAVLSGQVDDLVTSDLIWNNFVRGPAYGVLQAGGITGVAVPQSHFVTGSAQSLVKAMQKLVGSVSVPANAPALKLGDTGPAVSAWQTALNKWLQLTAPTQTPLTVDGTFGPGTQAATQALQTAQGITPDGTVGPTTRKALQQALAGAKQPAPGTSTPGSSAAAPILVLGAKGADVTSWQNDLNRWLKLNQPSQTQLTPDGTFGPSTQAATRAFQTAQGLTPDGTVGPATRQALARALAQTPRG